MAKKKKTGVLSRFVYRIILGIVTFFYPKMTVCGEENLPDGGCIIVGNHTQMNGPICGEIYIPGKRKIWCAHQMMELKEVPAYAFEDFWSRKPKYIRWFFKIVSYLIAPLSVALFNNAHTIPVYRDARLVSTFKQSVACLADDGRVVIYPECYEPHNHIVNKFQDRFVDVAKLYYRREGKEVEFVPMYIAPRLKSLYFGKPIRYDNTAPPEEERERICAYLMDEITKIAVSLPEHTVVPYENKPKREYNSNIPKEAE